MDDELVLEIDITWSDERKNQVKRTLNEVSILERDMRHGNMTPICNLTLINKNFRITWNEKTGKG